MDLNQFNASQIATLKQFREKVKDLKLPDSNDAYLVRWLIARNFDLDKADKMIRESMEWRRQNRIDTVLDEFKSPEVLTKYFPAGFVGRDKLKNPLWVVRYGAADMKGILQSVKKKDYLMHVVYLVESSIDRVKNDPARYKRSDDAIVQSIIIFDMDGFSMRHITYKPAMESAIKVLQLYEANYPEFLHKVFIVNAPKVFSIAFSILKPFLHERTKSKISIFSHEPKQWKAAILAEVDPEELPVAYGGTKADPDGNANCISMVNMGGEVPKSYYMSGKPDTTNKKSLEISRGSKEHLEYPIKETGYVLKWNFHSEDSDIAFAVYRKQGSELIPVVPHDRVDCHMSAEEGEILCDEAGVYVVEFDNSFSYLRQKKIWYAINIEKATRWAMDDNARNME